MNVIVLEQNLNLTHYIISVHVKIADAPFLVVS